MNRRYDLVAIGAGSTGLVASLTAARIGARVALVERDRPGGDCLWTGCVPSKALLTSAARAQAVRTAGKLGIEAGEPRVDFGAVMARVRDVIEAAGRRDTPAYLASQGVELVRASAAFAGPGRIEAGDRELRFRMALIGTGSRPLVPAIPGLGQVGPLTNENVFELDRLPGRLLVLGGGPVGCELGQAFSRLGSAVTLVEREPRLLPSEEPFAGELLRELLEGEGVAVRTGARAVAVSAAPDRSGTLSLDTGETLPFDRVLVAAGRTPNTEALGLERVGVRTDARGAVIVDRLLRTGGAGVYAGGDAIGDMQFTHVAAYHALVAVANGLFRAHRKVERRWTPWAIFTDPEVAHVGLTEQQARARHGRAVEVFELDHDELDRALTAGTRGRVKLVAGRRARLLGATIVGAAAGESIGEAARLIRERRRVGELSQMIHAYPTFSEGPARAADEFWRRRWMTPPARRRMRPLLALLRLLDRPRIR